jgi:hypothetical protein
MTFTFTDAWLLESIFNSEKKKEGALLRDIIGYSDYVNHAIIEWNDYKSSLPKLLQAGLVVQSAKTLSTTKKYMTWRTKKYKGKKRIYAADVMNDACGFMNETFKHLSSENAGYSLNLTEEDFSSEIKKYLK